MQDFLKYALMRATVIRALKVACLITPILTLFNHYDKMMMGDIAARFWFQVALTFVVPYCVSTYSSAMAGLEEQRRRANQAG